MRRGFVRVCRPVLLVAALLLLSGCLKLDADLTVSPDDTVTGTYVVAYKKDPKTKPPGLTTARPLLVTRGAAEARPYDDGDYLGTEYRLRGVPFADLAAFTAVTVQGRQTGTVQLTREGDDVLVAGTFDFRETSATTRTAEQDAQARRYFSVRIRLTFPGDVQSANGAISGRVVTWDIPPFVRTVLQARAAATPPPVAAPIVPAGSSNAARYALWVAIGLGGVAVLLAAALVVRGARRPRAEPAVASGPEASDFAWVLGERAAPPGPHPDRRRPGPGPDRDWNDRSGWTDRGRPTPPPPGPPPPRAAGPSPQPPARPRPVPATGPWDRTVAGAPTPPSASPAPRSNGSAPPDPARGEAADDRQWWGPFREPPAEGPGRGR